jgi:hypothetical protein
MKEYRFSLESGSKKHICPACGKRRFVRYVDLDQQKEYLPEQYGRCDRSVNCNYHLNPYADGFGTKDQKPFEYKPIPIQAEKPASYISNDILNKSLALYNENNFVQFLESVFGTVVTTELISRYLVGTSKHWPGSTVFWQIDTFGKIRSGKIMLYNANTGKRVKDPESLITWAHKSLKLVDFNLKQCFFGEHLLKLNQSKPVAVVESEKTAIIASYYMPDFIWLAVGSLTNLNTRICQVLEGRTVVLFPDLKCFDRWSEKAKDLSKQLPGTRFIISDYLEINANESEKESGFDIADYLLKPEPIKHQMQPDIDCYSNYQSQYIIGSDGLLYTNRAY